MWLGGNWSWRTYSSARRRTHSFGVKKTYRRLHSINILPLHAYTQIHSNIMNTEDQLFYIICFIGIININCLDRPMWRLLDVFPQKRKCYFYPQCMPLSSWCWWPWFLSGLPYYQHPLSPPVKPTHVHPENTWWDSFRRRKNVFLLLKPSFLFLCCRFSMETSAHAKAVRCHFHFAYYQTLHFLFVRRLIVHWRSEGCGQTHPSCGKGIK